MTTTNTGLIPTPVSKFTDGDVAKFYANLINLTHSWTVETGAIAYVRKVSSGGKVRLDGDSNDEPRYLAIYGSCATDAAILNPLAEGETVSAVNAQFYHMLSLSLGGHILKLGRLAIQYAILGRKTATAKQADAEAKAGTKASKAKKADKKDFTEEQLISSMKANEKVNELDDDQILQVADLLSGIITDIDATTLTEYDKVAKDAGVTGFLNITYFRRERQSRVTCRIFNENQRKIFPSVRSKSWDVFTVLLKRIMHVTDLSELSHKATVQGAPSFETTVTTFVDLYGRLMPLLPLLDIKVNKTAYNEAKDTLAYIPQLYGVAKWAVTAQAQPQPQQQPSPFGFNVGNVNNFSNPNQVQANQPRNRFDAPANASAGFNKFDDVYGATRTTPSPAAFTAPCVPNQYGAYAGVVMPQQPVVYVGQPVPVGAPVYPSAPMVQPMAPANYGAPQMVGQQAQVMAPMAQPMYPTYQATPQVSVNYYTGAAPASAVSTGNPFVANRNLGVRDDDKMKPGDTLVGNPFARA